MPMVIPFVLFWVLVFLYFGSEELGIKGSLTAVVIGIVLFIGYFTVFVHLFIAAQAIVDVVLILIILGGDIRIR